MNTVQTNQPITKETDLNRAIATHDRAMLLFYATWCPFCLRFLPVFRKYAETREGFLMVQDDTEEMGEVFFVEVMPTVIFMENGVVQKRLDGIMGMGLTESGLADFIMACQM